MSEILTRTHNLLLNHSAEKRSSVDELETQDRRARARRFLGIASLGVCVGFTRRGGLENLAQESVGFTTKRLQNSAQEPIGFSTLRGFSGEAAT